MIRILLIYVCIPMLLTGCWGRSELKDVSIVSGVGMDLLDNKIRVTTEILKPNDIRKGKPKPYIVDETQGITVFEAVRDFIIKSGKKLLWSHVNTFIIGDKTAEQGVEPLVGFMLRDHEPRSTMNVLVSEGLARDLMKVQGEQGPSPSMAMQQALKQQESLSKAPQVEFHDFVQNLYSPNVDPYLPIVRRSDGKFEIYGTAIFKESSMVGKLSSTETRGFLRAVGKLKGGIQVVRFPSSSNRPTYASLEIKKSETNYSLQVNGSKPKIVIEIAETSFYGSETEKIQLDLKKMRMINKRYQEDVRKEVLHSVQKVQKGFGSEALGFAKIIRTKNKQYWNEIKDRWEEIYPTIEVDVRVKTKLPEEGLIKSNILNPKENKGVVK